MSGNSNVRLKSTGEPVMVLVETGADSSVRKAASGYKFCRLPPQSPGHRRRFQWISEKKLG